jgi:hypothetical protein
VTGDDVELRKNANGQVGDGGDSGGPDFVVGPGGMLGSIASVQSTCRPTGYVPGKPLTWQWATGVSYCTSTLLYRIRDSIVAHVRDEKPFDRTVAEVTQPAGQQYVPRTPHSPYAQPPGSIILPQPRSPYSEKVGAGERRTGMPGGGASASNGPVVGEPGGFAGPAPTMAATFDTDFGVLTLTAKDGTYSVNNGHVTVDHIYGDFMDGAWTQSTAAQQCSDGTYHGRFHFRFDARGFTGSYGYCDGQVNAGQWNGTRRVN